MEPTTIVLGAAGISIGGMVLIKGISAFKRVRHRKALNGDFGPLEKWKAELLEERPELIQTYKQLPQKDKIYIRTVAESKEQFVSETMERLNEYLEGTEFEGITADDLQ